MSSASRIIEKFGGTRPAAQALGVPTSTVQSWKQSGVIPARRQPDVLKIARERNIPIEPADFIIGAAA